jgi:hypothetical protein
MMVLNMLTASFCQMYKSMSRQSITALWIESIKTSTSVTSNNYKPVGHLKCSLCIYHVKTILDNSFLFTNIINCVPQMIPFLTMSFYVIKVLCARKWQLKQTGDYD